MGGRENREAKERRFLHIPNAVVKSARSFLISLYYLSSEGGRAEKLPPWGCVISCEEFGTASLCVFGFANADY